MVGISDLLAFSMRIQTFPLLECLHSLDSHRLQVWTLLLGAHRDPPQALDRGQCSLTPLAAEGEGRFYSEDTPSIQFSL